MELELARRDKLEKQIHVLDEKLTLARVVVESSPWMIIDSTPTVNFKQQLLHLFGSCGLS